MFYRYSLTVPAATPESAPVETTMYLCQGIVHYAEIAFPPGCAAWVHVAIFRYEHQVWPTNPDEWFAWDDYTVTIPRESLSLVDVPYELLLRAWSEDTSYAHTITCRVGVRMPEVHRPGSWVGRLLRGEWGE